ncbi:unnamed protein product, partial [Choristocarpus tenellus]
AVASSKGYQSYLYGCILHLLVHTQGTSHGGGSWGDGEDMSGVASEAHEIQRSTHRLNNMDRLREHLEALAHLLGRDVCSGPVVTQCLALSLLTTVLATLGTGPSGERDLALYNDDSHRRASQGSQARFLLLRMLYDNGCMSRLVVLAGGGGKR